MFLRYVEIFKDGDNDALAKVIAADIEDAVKLLHDPDRDAKLYLQKNQMLIFNLKKNDVS
jgi:hypothetical protein